MWCGTCQSDVVTEVASDHRRVSCSICGATLGETAASHEPAAESASPRTAKTSQARELLDRWAKSPLFDPYGPARAVEPELPAAKVEQAATPPDEVRSEPAPAVASSPEPPESKSSEPAKSPRAEDLDRLTEEILSRVSRITESIREPAPDSPPSVEEPSPPVTNPESSAVGSASTEIPEADSATASPVEGETGPGEDLGRSETNWRVDPGPSAEQRQPSPASRSFDAAGNPVAAEPAQQTHNAHTEAAVAASTEVARPESAGLSNPPEKSGFVGGIGQVLAYLGILCLTAGTTMVITGYFGGPAHYAPTGWLITTIGQMMLFLGVVTLVSTGMEQTQAEMRESLDETLREVSSRIDFLSQHVTRIDTTAHQTPPPPHTLTRTPADLEAARSTQQ